MSNQNAVKWIKFFYWLEYKDWCWMLTESLRFDTGCTVWSLQCKFPTASVPASQSVLYMLCWFSSYCCLIFSHYWLGHGQHKCWHLLFVSHPTCGVGEITTITGKYMYSINVLLHFTSDHKDILACVRRKLAPVVEGRIFIISQEVLLNRM